MTRIDGYGTSIDYDGDTIELIAGKVESKIWRTASVRFPVTDILEVSYRAANIMVNGEMRFKTARPANDYATPREDGAPTIVPNNGLTIHWRKKDEQAFAALRAEIPVAVE